MDENLPTHLRELKKSEMSSATSIKTDNKENNRVKENDGYETDRRKNYNSKVKRSDEKKATSSNRSSDKDSQFSPIKSPSKRAQTKKVSSSIKGDFNSEKDASNSVKSNSDNERSGLLLKKDAVDKDANQKGKRDCIKTDNQEESLAEACSVLNPEAGDASSSLIEMSMPDSSSGDVSRKYRF